MAWGSSALPMPGGDDDDDESLIQACWSYDECVGWLCAVFWYANTRAATGNSRASEF